MATQLPKSTGLKLCKKKKESRGQHGGGGSVGVMNGAEFGKSKQFRQKMLVGLVGDMSGFPSVRIIQDFSFFQLFLSP